MTSFADYDQAHRELVARLSEIFEFDVRDDERWRAGMERAGLPMTFRWPLLRTADAQRRSASLLHQDLLGWMEALWQRAHEKTEGVLEELDERKQAWERASFEIVQAQEMLGELASVDGWQGDGARGYAATIGERVHALSSLAEAFELVARNYGDALISARDTLGDMVSLLATGVVECGGGGSGPWYPRMRAARGALSPVLEEIQEAFGVADLYSARLNATASEAEARVQSVVGVTGP